MLYQIGECFGIHFCARPPPFDLAGGGGLTMTAPETRALVQRTKRTLHLALDVVSPPPYPPPRIAAPLKKIYEKFIIHGLPENGVVART
jgi:hypothetical protein